MDIKIYLRDKNIHIVNAWKKAFCGDSNVEVSCGNIFDLTADAIISPANSFGFMDGGIDLVYSEYFGWNMEKELQKHIRNEFFGEITEAYGFPVLRGESFQISDFVYKGTIGEDCHE